MNGDGSLPQNPPPQPKNKGFAFLKVGILEIFFVVITLAIFFGVINYFNILSISKIFPNQLGWLPHRPYEQSQQYTSKTPPLADNKTGTATTVPPASTSAKQTLVEFLSTILNPSLVLQSSSDINLREDKGVKQSFSGSWDTKDGKAIAIFTLSPDGREISQLLIFFPYATTVSASVELAQSTIPKLFSITPKGKWGCKTLNNTIDYCENFWEEENRIRRGVAVRSNRPYSQAKKLTVLFCEHSQASTLYPWKSCQFELAQTGVQ